MQNNHTSKQFKDLLDKLQQESWQLELIISGFALYGLFQSIEPLAVEQLKAIKNDEMLYSFFLSPLYNSVFILLFILLMHVILRGLWIGALGLRYVSGDIEYEKLKYSEKFTVFLQTKVGSFDKFISRLENICSTLFALAFLMIFYFISFFMVMGLLALIAYTLGDINKTSRIIILVVYGFLSLLLLIDFFGAGILKKNKTISKLYFPIYRFFGFVTLAFFYRPLVYNFLDQKKAKWLSVFIVPVYIVITGVSSGFGMVNSNFQVLNPVSSANYLINDHYEDLMIEKTDFTQFVSIPSKKITKTFLPIFIGFNNFMEDAIFENDSTLKPKKDKRGYGFQLEKFSGAGGAIQVDLSLEVKKEQRKYLNIVNKLYQFKIDSTTFKKSLVFSRNERGRFGFETFLDIKNLERGKHVLYFIGPEKKKEHFVTDTLVTIPFWYYPD